MGSRARGSISRTLYDSGEGLQLRQLQVRRAIRQGFSKKVLTSSSLIGAGPLLSSIDVIFEDNLI